MTFRIVRPGASHVDDWAAMRAALWPDASCDEHRTEIAASLQQDAGDSVAFLALDDQARAIGFVEATLRRDYVNGCDTSPVAFLEGLYVAPSGRHQGIARALAEAVTAWARAKGCTEMASDADLANTDSHAVHAAIGFTETERVVYFRKSID